MEILTDSPKGERQVIMVIETRLFHWFNATRASQSLAVATQVSGQACMGLRPRARKETKGGLVAAHFHSLAFHFMQACRFLLPLSFLRQSLESVRWLR